MISKKYMSFIIYIKLSFIENHPQHCSSIHLEMTLNWKVCFISVLCKWKIFRNDLFLKKLSGRQTIWHRMMTFCMKKQFFTNFLELFLNYFYVLYFLYYIGFFRFSWEKSHCRDNVTIHQYIILLINKILSQ